MSKVEIKNYSPRDHENFKKYINENFHEKYILGDKRYINWQYNGNFFIAQAGEEVIGHFGCRDIEYKINDETKPVRILMNLSVVESYRMTGAAPLLAEEIFKTQNPILVSDARPVAHQLFSHFRDSWKELGNLKRYFGVLNPNIEILKDFKPFKSINENAQSKEFTIESNTEISDEDLKTFWAEARERYPITIERSPEYLKWRFFEHPFFDYQILTARQKGQIFGYTIWRLEKSEGVNIARIIDFISQKKADLALLEGFTKEAKKAQADIVDFFHSGDFYKEALESADWFDVEGRKFEGFPILFSPLSFRRSSINIECDFEADLSRGYFTKADGDQDRPNPH